MGRWVVVLPLAAGLASLAAAATLLLWLHRLRGAQEKLMARQLWHLALANLIECGMLIVWFALDLLNFAFGVGRERTEVLDGLCTFSLWNNAAFMTSLLVEVHIAMATAAALYRSHTALRALSCTVAFLWPLGFCMGAIVVFPSGIFWDPEIGSCDTKADAGEQFKAAIITLALCICFVTYIAGFVGAITHGGLSLQARVWGRVKFFLAAAMVSWFPFVLFSYINVGGLIAGRLGRFDFHFVFTFFMSNGWLNTCVYALESKFIARAERRRELQLQRMQQLDPADISMQGLDQPAIPEFAVGFRDHASFKVIPLTQADEREIAEVETAALETQRRGQRTLTGSNQSHARVVTLRMEEQVAEDLFGCFDEHLPHAAPDDASLSSPVLQS